MSRCHPFLWLTAIYMILLHMHPTFGISETEPIIKSSLHAILSQKREAVKAIAPSIEQAIA
jgi:hypothetical protein